MPGSLLNLQEVHSDLSDVSTKSVDSRASGKKVSFNKAVRVKQYPWQPDDYGEGDETLTLPNQRFWFKVYKNNLNQDYQNSWKDGAFPAEEYDTDVVDSLTPIAEDDDVSAEVDQLGLQKSNHPHYRRYDNGYIRRNFPPEPPVDYIDDVNVPNYDRRSKLVNGGVEGPIESQNRPYGKRDDSRCNARDASVNGIMVSGPKSHDFKRPTISSAAKCISDSKAKFNGNKQATSSGRLPRMALREFTPERTRKDSPKFNKLRERRSRSTDNNESEERNNREIIRVDKAVSTDDLSSDYKENEENSSKDRLWWRKKTSTDKSTQFTGTITKNKITNSFIREETHRPALSSTSNHVQWNKGRDFPIQNERNFGEKGKLIGARKENYSGQNGLHAGELKPLSLCGKNFISGHKRNDDFKSQNWRLINNEQKVNHSDSFEYDYVTGDLEHIKNNRNAYICTTGDTNTMTNEEKPKSFPWRTITNRKSHSEIGKSSRSASPDRTKDIRGSSTIGYVRGTQISNENGVQAPTISIPKIKSSESSRVHYMSDQENRGRNVAHFRSPSRERSSSSDRGYHLRGVDNDQSMIDWSLSGFQLGSRQDTKMSSSSDSECVVHRRPPLLMYIPGVSHHNRPAIEDDRLSALSGMSRSEAEDDISPLISANNGEFKRRHSMPRNGKLNWLKRKANKKTFPQT